MKQVIRHVAAIALAATTMGAGATQAQAGSDLSRAFKGAVTIGIIADKLDKKKSHRHVGVPSFSNRSFHRSRIRGNHRAHRRVIRRGSHRAFERARHSRHFHRRGIWH